MPQLGYLVLHLWSPLYEKIFPVTHSSFFMLKDPQHFTFNDMEIRVPSARQLVYADKRANPQGRIPDNTWVLRPQDIPNSYGGDESVWYFSRVCGTFKERAGWHPTPLSVFETPSK